jgi:transcriptional regulator with XRE-family HTH domain
MLRLEFERRSRGWTQADLARKLRVTQQAIAAWESGVRGPRLAHLVRLQELFGCEPTRLMKGVTRHTAITTVIPNAKG